MILWRSVPAEAGLSRSRRTDSRENLTSERAGRRAGMEYGDEELIAWMADLIERRENEEEEEENDN